MPQADVNRFMLDRSVGEGAEEVELPEAAARQVATVLRMREGEEVVVFDGSGREWRGALATVSRSAVRVRLGAPATPRREPSRRVTLCQALLKADRMEWVLQKGTELGVARFEPLLTERVVAAKREAPERWRRILMEATEQCGGTRVPELAEPAPLAMALAAAGAAEHLPGALCWEAERDEHLATWLGQRRPTEVRLFVGPEGGFSESEAALARAQGVATVSLGQRVLRAETAAVAASTLALLAP